MKARSKELLDRAIAATIAAIEIYNKPEAQVHRGLPGGSSLAKLLAEKRPAK